MTGVLALFGNFDFTELVVVAAVAVILFGKRLPEVAMRAAAQVVKVRRSLGQMWRDAGLEDELRRVRREVEHGLSPPRGGTAESFGSVRRRVSGSSGGAVEAPRTPAANASGSGGETPQAPESSAEGTGAPPAEGPAEPTDDRESA